MIYQRRALQRRLNELRSVLNSHSIDKLAERLNRPGRDRVAAMWEVVVLHGLSKCGHLQNEVALKSLRRPDIFFEQGDFRLIADVTSVSDEGLDRDNPYYELNQLIENAKNKLKLPLGGLDLRVHSRQENTKRGIRTVLMLPPRCELQEFVNTIIVPKLSEQIAAKAFPLRIQIDDGGISLDITIDPSKSPYSSGGFAAYDIPKIKDKNPLYNALRAKADQLRGADELTGIIVGDGDCVSLSDSYTNSNRVSTKDIVDEFFRQHSSVNFVLLLSVRESQPNWMSNLSTTRQNYPKLFFRGSEDAYLKLVKLFDEMLKHLPTPVMMPANGSIRAFENDYYLGHHGGYSVSGEKVVRFSLREFTEIFAGLRTLQDNGAKNVVAARKFSQEPSYLQVAVLNNLLEGRLPEEINIIKTDENDNDDWVEIRFGEVDPAIAPLR